MIGGDGINDESNKTAPPPSRRDTDIHIPVSKTDEIDTQILKCGDTEVLHYGDTEIHR